MNETPLAERLETLIAHLEDWQESKDPCENGHVEHTAADHLGRRLVHSLSPRGFGADWDYAAAVEYIRGATEIVGRFAGHAAVKGADGRVMGFAFRAPRRDVPAVDTTSDGQPPDGTNSPTGSRR